MALSIIVCVKPVPASDSVTIDPKTKTIRRNAGDNVLGTQDKNALELAADLKKIRIAQLQSCLWPQKARRSICAKHLLEVETEE